jgi:hypothetical protein
MSLLGRSLKAGYSGSLVGGYAVTSEKLETQTVLRL